MGTPDPTRMRHYSGTSQDDSKAGTGELAPHRARTVAAAVPASAAARGAATRAGAAGRPCHAARLAKQCIVQVKLMDFALFCRHWPAHPPRVDHCWGRHRHRRPSGRGGARAQSGEEGRRSEATSCPTCGEQHSCGRRCSRLVLLPSAPGTHGTRGGRADSERWQGKPSCSAP